MLIWKCCHVTCRSYLLVLLQSLDCVNRLVLRVFGANPLWVVNAVTPDVVFDDLEIWSRRTYP